MIGSLNRFIKKSGAISPCAARNLEDIITNSMSSTLLLHERLGKEIPVSLIFDNKESGDEAYIYSYASDGVKVGDYLYSDRYDKHYLTYHRIKAVATDDHLCKMKSFECNVSFKYKNQEVFGYLITNTRQKLDESFSDLLGSLFDNKTVLVIQDGLDLKISDCLLISGRQWKIVDYNNIPNPGVVYITLENVLNTMEEKTPMLKDEEAEVKELKQGYEYNFATEQGYFKSEPAVEIVKKSNNNVLVRIPYNINSITVKVREQNSIVSYIYEVGE